MPWLVHCAPYENLGTVLVEWNGGVYYDYNYYYRYVWMDVVGGCRTRDYLVFLEWGKLGRGRVREMIELLLFFFFLYFLEGYNIIYIYIFIFTVLI
jgi:hypothetical protein